METNYTDILNVFIKYYNTINGTSNNLFSNIGTYEDTNDMMEELFDHVSMFNESDEETKKLYNLSSIILDEYDHLYGLKIDEKIICVCELLFPILVYVVREIDWTQVPWKIILFTK
jgi:hypothetical protein